MAKKTITLKLNKFDNYERKKYAAPVLCKTYLLDFFDIPPKKTKKITVVLSTKPSKNSYEVTPILSGYVSAIELHYKLGAHTVTTRVNVFPGAASEVVKFLRKHSVESLYASVYYYE